MLEAERQFRRIIGYNNLATLIAAIENEQATETKELDTTGILVVN